MKNLLLACAVALSAALLATPAFGDEPATDKPPAKPKLICKKVPTIGTRLTTRVCKTPEQIEQERQNAKEATQEYQRDGSMQLEKGT